MHLWNVSSKRDVTAIQIRTNMSILWFRCLCEPRPPWLVAPPPSDAASVRPRGFTPRVGVTLRRFACFRVSKGILARHGPYAMVPSATNGSYAKVVQAVFSPPGALLRPSRGASCVTHPSTYGGPTLFTLLMGGGHQGRLSAHRLQSVAPDIFR